MRKIFYIVNVDWFFISHRLPLAVNAINEGYEVYLLTADTGKKLELESLGIHFIDIPFKRSGTNPIHELKCIYLLWRNIKDIKPDVIHNITLKAALLASLASKFAGNKNVINAISGFGYNFTDNRRGILQKIVKLLIRLVFRSSTFSFILQNPDDVNLMLKLNLVEKNRLYLIKGSGVDLNQFCFQTLPIHSKLRILFPARILVDKGICELLEAANLIKNEFQDRIEFILAGDCDKENLAVFPEAELRRHLIPNYITWLGFQKEMYSLYVNSDIVVLPSYREGLPKSLIEACAVGRPIITTDVPGCRECVIQNYNGILVPVKDTLSLANAIKELVNDFNKRIKYGKNSRLLAEKEFSIENVINKTFKIYQTYF